MANHLEEEQIAGIPRWALVWEARAKLLAAVFYIFAVISLTTPSFAALAYLISLAGALLMGIPLAVLLKRYLIITPFLLLMTVPLFFSQGPFLAFDHVAFAVLIILKAFTSMTVITIILDTQSLEQFMNSLADLKVPPVLITVLMLSYRYVFLFLDDFQKMQLAAKSRFFRGGIGIKRLKIYGQLTGALLVQSLDRSDHVYEAMASRCFNGTFRFKHSRKLTAADLSKTLFACLLIVTLVFLERVFVG
ncbi:cobalt ECF transporter T component CbiQ [Shouchella shacheensis]|uniref:cobalt ECF transporter T component CbiQ n=1 Tax=Shouchella shacheensis TaxID=1649580 RepID=UPI00073FBDB9|nr:cobalt ECF transporter T component CbiQ [Shouchella shacheensis]